MKICLKNQLCEPGARENAGIEGIGKIFVKGNSHLSLGRRGFRPGTNYTPQVPGAEKGFNPGFHAEVLMKNGVLHLRAVRISDNKETVEQDIQKKTCLEQYTRFPKNYLGIYKKVEFEVFTETQITQGNETRLRNWHRLIPWVAQVQFHSLAHYTRVLEARLNNLGSIDAASVLQLSKEEGEDALFMAAAIQAVAQGRIDSDLDMFPFSANTQFKKI